MLDLLIALTVAGSPGASAASVAALDGKMHRPVAEAKGNPVALVFIAHDCPICNAYAPELSRLANRYGKAGVPVELVYEEPNLTAQAARAHAKAYSYGGLKMFLDPSAALARSCGVTVTPEAVVFDAAGHVTYRGRIDDQYVSFGKQRTVVTSHDLRAALDATIHHKPVEHPRTPAIGCYISAISS